MVSLFVLLNVLVGLSLASTEAISNVHGTGVHVDTQIKGELLAVLEKRIFHEQSILAEVDSEVEDLLEADVAEESYGVVDLPLLPGTELIGTGMDLKKGFDTSSFTRSAVVSTPTQQFDLKPNSYGYPSYVAVRRNFNANMKTRVYNDAQEKFMDLSAEAGVEFQQGMFSGSAEAKLKIESKSGKKTVLSESSLDVQLYDVLVTKITENDLSPEFKADFEALPANWEAGPHKYQAFIVNWGTHFLRSAKVGGSFKMLGTTTTSDTVDNLKIAAAVRMTYDAIVTKISGYAKVDYDSKNSQETYDNSFSFKASGGDPAVGAMLAAAHKSNDKSGAAEDAIKLWLDSLKSIPTVYEYGLKEIHELFPSNGSDERETKKRAIKQAIDIHFREGDNSLGTMTLKVGPPVWSNFYRIEDRCLRFSAVIGPDSTLNVHLTAVPSSPKPRGYEIRINSSEVQMLRDLQVVRSTDLIEAVSPGSSVLYSSYIICYESSTGSLLYGRNKRVVLSFSDSHPESAYFFGFSIRGPATDTVLLTGMQVTPVGDLGCPAVFGNPCNNHGTCNTRRICQCEQGWVGFACQYACPVSNGAICGNRGACEVPGTQAEHAAAFCQCKEGFAGLACEYQKPTISLRVPALILSGHTTRFEFTSQPDIQPTSVQWTLSQGNVKSDRTVFEVQPTPGEATVSVQVYFPGISDPISASRSISIIDCTCGGHGACDSKGVCQCQTGFAGAQCNQCAQYFMGLKCQCDTRSTCKNGGQCTPMGTCCCTRRFGGVNCESCAAGRSGRDCADFTDQVADQILDYFDPSKPRAVILTEVNSKKQKFFPHLNFGNIGQAIANAANKVSGSVTKKPQSKHELASAKLSDWDKLTCKQ